MNPRTSLIYLNLNLLVLHFLSMFNKIEWIKRFQLFVSKDDLDSSKRIALSCEFFVIFFIFLYKQKEIGSSNIFIFSKHCRLNHSLLENQVEVFSFQIKLKYFKNLTLRTIEMSRFHTLLIEMTYKFCLATKYFKSIG